MLAVLRSNYLAMIFSRLCGLRRCGRIKSGIPLETRTNGICGEKRCHDCGKKLNDLWGAGRWSTERDEGYLGGFIDDKRRIISDACGKFTPTLSYIKRIGFVLNLLFDKSYSRH